MDVKKSKKFEKHQEEICELCQESIIGGASMSPMFMCEGRFCEEAFEQFLEETELEE